MTEGTFFGLAILLMLSGCVAEGVLNTHHQHRMEELVAEKCGEPVEK